jgi:hypothetical protein
MSKKKNILVITQWSYKDALIQAYTLPYVLIIADILPAGSKIYLVTFEQDNVKMTAQERNEIKQNLLNKGIVLIDYTYHRFGILAILKWFFSFMHLLSISVFKKINFIHAWCTTAGSLGYVVSLFSGKPLIIDSYEPHAEAMAENGSWNRSELKFKILFYFEKKLSYHAKYIISATKGMSDYAKRKYGITLKDSPVKPACVDFNSFNAAKRKDAVLLKELKLEDKIVCVYAGKFGGNYLSTEVFDFFHEAENIWGDRFRALLLTPQKKEELDELVNQSRFDSNKMVARFVSHKDIPSYMGLGDFAINPMKRTPAKLYCTPIKDGEYWAMGLPVVISDGISDDSDIIKKHRAGAILKGLEPVYYKEALMEIDQLLREEKNTLSERITVLAHQYRNFSIAENVYRKFYGENS